MCVSDDLYAFLRVCDGCMRVMLCVCVCVCEDVSVSDDVRG